ncbi:hypothetical protein R3P38DRAFT_2797513 [Favolaschia claudopus]|uniref:Uncharacterized protein n=1 Tax=Favolaschia claudopus TaxID=2862362 RepID=A0AAW0A2W2_9AGAR
MAQIKYEMCDKKEEYGRDNAYTEAFDAIPSDVLSARDSSLFGVMKQSLDDTRSTPLADSGSVDELHKLPMSNVPEMRYYRTRSSYNAASTLPYLTSFDAINRSSVNTLVAADTTEHVNKLNSDRPATSSDGSSYYRSQVVAPSTEHVNKLDSHRPASSSDGSSYYRSRQEREAVSLKRKYLMLQSTMAEREDHRRIFLNDDQWVSQLTPWSLRCRACLRKVNLDRIGRYYTGKWKKHRNHCKDIMASEILRANGGRCYM